MENFLFVFVALLLVLLNGVFVAAEFGLVKLRQTRVRAIAKRHGWRGKILADVHRQIDAYLSACQLGITLTSLGLGWIGEPAFASLLAPLFQLAGIASAQVIHGISFALAFSVISFLHIVVGELVPKSLALRHPEGVGLLTATPLYGFYWLMYPAIRALNLSANWVLRLTKFGSERVHEAGYSADELKLILRGRRVDSGASDEELNVMAQMLDFGELDVSELMRPIHEMVALRQGASLEENLDVILRHRYSRYPYFDRDGRNVLGVIHLKDLFLAQQQGKSIESLASFLRPIQYVSPRMAARVLFQRFRAGAPHFAIVGKKGEPPHGFITLDNILGALVGAIHDEFRPYEQEWARQPDGTFIGKGSLPIYTLERALAIDIENEEMNLEDADSIGGMILEKLGEIPQEGRRIAFAQFDIVIRKMHGMRIGAVQVYPKPQASEPA